MTATDKQKLKDNFREKLCQYVDQFNKAVSTDDGAWVVKGFIDIFRNIYTISVDTKVISKIMELLLFPKICEFARENNLKFDLCKEQNHYPDVTFIDTSHNKFAVDLKSTYRKSETSVSGMTLGAFTGYFRDRTSTKNISFPYEDYAGHFILGLIYTRSAKVIDESEIYQIEDLDSIESVVHSFEFFIQEKYKIAVDRPGSGNTKNIGSVNKIKELIRGGGPFTKLGEKTFDDYWMYYLTKDMARAADMAKPPYRNLKEYLEYKSR